MVDQETSLDQGLQCRYLVGVQSEKSVFSVEKYKRFPWDPRLRCHNSRCQISVLKSLYSSCPH